MITLALIGGSALGHFFLILILAALAYVILDWAIKSVGLPDPFNKVLRVALVVAAAAVALNEVFELAGHRFLSI